MKKQLVTTGFIFLLISLIILSGCIGEENNTPSELERFIGTWGETYGTEIVGNVTFHEDGTGTAYSSDNFPEAFNYNISDGKITVTQSGSEEPTTYDYFFSDNYNTLNIKSIFEIVTIYKKQ